MDQQIPSMSSLFNFTQDSIKKAAGAGYLPALNKTAVDTEAALASTNAGVIASATDAQLKLNQTGAELSQSIYDQKVQLQSSLSAVFKEQQGTIDAQLKAGQDAALAAENARIEMLKADAQDTGLNPLAWVVKQFHVSSLKDTAVNKANEASARFEAAATVESVTSNRMQQIATGFAVDKGLQLQAAQQLNAEQIASSRTQEALLTNALQTSSKLAGGVMAAKRQEFQDSMTLASWQQNRKIQDMQLTKMKQDVVDENSLAVAARKILGLTDSISDVAASRNLIKRMPAESLSSLARASVAIQGAVSKEDARGRLLTSLTVPELHSVGVAVGDSGLANFGNVEFNTAVRKTVGDLNARSFSDAVANGSVVRNQAVWEASPEGKSQIARNNEQAQSIVMQQFSSGPAAGLADAITSSVVFPKSFNALSGLNDDNYKVFLSGIKNEGKRQQVWNALKPGQPLNTQVNALANQYVSSGVDYTLANAMALSDVLSSGAVGLPEAKAHEVSASIIRSAAYGNLVASNPSAGVLIAAGQLKPDAIKVPYEHNGLTFNLANPVDINNLAKREKYKLNNPGTSISSLVTEPVGQLIDYHMSGVNAVGDVLSYEGARKTGVSIPSIPAVNAPYKHTGTVDPFSPDFGKGLLEPVPVDKIPKGK